MASYIYLLITYAALMLMSKVAFYYFNKKQSKKLTRADEPVQKENPQIVYSADRAMGTSQIRL